MLAGEPIEGDGIAAVMADEGVEDGESEDGTVVAEPSPLDDGFVRTFVRVSVHVHRFFPYYLGAAAWVLVMLLMSPAGERGADDGELAGFRQPSTANLSPAGEFDSDAPAAEVPAAPSGFGDIAAIPSSDSSFSLSMPSDTTTDAPSDDFSSTTFDSSAFESSSGTSEITIDDEPEPLRISKSGYSSRTGGTPLEQEPPGGGLPVGAVAGEASKRSFVALTGDETVLRLKLVDDPSNVGAESAAIRACPIVTGWEASRGASMDAEPAWAEPCIDAVRGDDGVWTFDLSTFGAPGDADGFALTPGTAAGLSFNLTFDPAPVRGS